MVSPSSSLSASPAPESSRPNFNGAASPAVQNHMHTLASNLPPPRKQNQACDACRTRKVKCQQLPGQDKCQHCQTKNYPCTHYVQQATTEKKRAMASSRRPRAAPSVPSESNLTLDSTQTLPPLHHSPLPSNQPPPSSSPVHQSPTAQLLHYLFSPEENFPMPQSIGGSIGAGYRAYNRSATSPSNTMLHHGSSPGFENDWADIYRKLSDESFRIEFALDLVEVFFQICHTRMPLLNPDQIRSRLRNSLPRLPPHPSHRPPSPPAAPNASPSAASTNPPALPFALLATLIAWGAKFSEHPILVLDRKLSTAGRSRLARVLVKRAREVAEGEKIHRVPTPDNVVIALLLDPLQSQSITDPDGYKGFWINCAIRHLFELQINHRSATECMDRQERGMMVFAWWMACLSDSFGSVYFRRKPCIDDEDYNHEFDSTGALPISTPTSATSQSPGATTQAEYLNWFAAAHDMARNARQMSKTLWRPSTAEEGIPFEVLRGLCSALIQWREQHLSRVGVPTNFEAEWDFVAAVSACSSDASYHVMWIILFNALDEFGLKESNDLARAQDQGLTTTIAMTRNEAESIDAIKTQVMDEALHGALRIAALAGVLTTNGYLRLDPNVLHWSIYAAGILLARLGRPEVSNCISGLQQYGFAYEEALDQAAEMTRIYNAAAPHSDPMSFHPPTVQSSPGTGSHTIGGTGLNYNESSPPSHLENFASGVYSAAASSEHCETRNNGTANESTYPSLMYSR